MINECSGFSIIICAHTGSEYVKLLYKSLLENSDSRLEHEIIVIADDPSWQLVKVLQENKINYFITNFRCPYKSWNYGVSISKKDWICLMPEDVYPAKGWDSGLLRWDQGSHNKGLWMSTFVEPNCDPNSPRVIRANFGMSWKDFDKEGFDKFVLENSREELVRENYFVPHLMHRYWFLNDIGGYPTCELFSPQTRKMFYRSIYDRCEGGCGFDNRFKDICRQKGYEFKNARNSWFYHFMAGAYPEKDKAWYDGGFGTHS